MRVAGWAFRAKKKMAFDEYQRKDFVRQANGKRYYEYRHQINHMGGHPENCCLDRLELVTAGENKDLYAVEAKDLWHSVYKRPAAATATVYKRPAGNVKRPAAATVIAYKRPAQKVQKQPRKRGDMRISQQDANEPSSTH